MLMRSSFCCTALMVANAACSGDSEPQAASIGTTAAPLSVESTNTNVRTSASRTVYAKVGNARPIHAKAINQ